MYVLRLEQNFHKKMPTEYKDRNIPFHRFVIQAKEQKLCSFTSMNFGSGTCLVLCKLLYSLMFLQAR